MVRERGGDFPNRVDKIAVGRTCDRLQFLQACVFNEPTGTEIGHYLVHYADGDTRRIPILYGADVLDWGRPFGNPDEQPPPTLAWTGKNAFYGVQLFLRTWDNPKKDVAIERLDFVSAMGNAAPFLVAVTAEVLKP